MAVEFQKEKQVVHLHMALSYVRLYFYLSFFFTNITKTVRIILWSQRGLLGLIWLLFFLFVFKWVPLLGGGLRIRKCYQDSPISHERIFGLDTKLWEMAPTHNGLFPQKKAINLFFSIALPIFGMSKKCRYFFDSFVIWRCKDDCNKGFSI